MKILLKNILVLSICGLAFWSCEKDDDKTIARAGASPVLYASASEVALLESMAHDNAVAFTWTAPDFGYNAVVTYTLELSKKGENFTNPVSVSIGKSLYRKEFTVAEFNALMIEAGLAPEVTADVEARTKATIAATVAPLYSAPVTLTTAPYTKAKPTESPYATVYMVGTATEFGWDGAKGTPMLRDVSDPFIYIFTGYFATGDLKVLGNLNEWIPNWGYGSDGNLAVRNSEADADPPSIKVTAPGYYTFTVNLYEETYSLVAYDASAAATYTTVGITGDFNSWANAGMSHTNFNPHLWQLDYTLPEDTNLKFSTPDWSQQWNIFENWNRLYGKAAPGPGGNMWMLAGTYKFVFNDLDSRYVLVKK